jgi:DNA-binding NarL/FixJ family response regulator
MAYSCCLAGSDAAMVSTFATVLSTLRPAAVTTLARLDVVELARRAPELLVCDVDELEVDPLEMLRRIRFVLPHCTIAVYTGTMERAWSVACHLAGVNCMLSKYSKERVLVGGIRAAIESGCYTDPRFTERRDLSKDVTDFALFKNATSRFRDD